MLKSMTGFGRAQASAGGIAVTVEIKSVNHRYFECNVRAPRMYGFLEDRLKALMKTGIARGKVDCSVQIDLTDGETTRVQVDGALAQSYMQALQELKGMGLRDDISVMSVSRLPDVLTITREELDDEALWALVQPAARQALDQMIAVRAGEGARMQRDMMEKSEQILALVRQIEQRSPQTVEEYRGRLLERMRQVLEETAVDEQRILMEAAVYADKTAVDEETVRLRSHFEQLQEILQADEAVGRRLDFLVQEMNREANTIGSKAQDVEITRAVLDIKTAIEKIREQVQNVE